MKSKLNCIGYPHDDPYGLIAAFKKTFGFNKEKKDESNTPKPKKRINPKARKISRRSL